jgi:aspartate kinase
MIATSPIKISCVIDADQVPAAVRALHEAFELGADAVRREEPTGTDHRPIVPPEGREDRQGEAAA